MPDNVDKYLKLQKRADELQREADRAAGAHYQLLERLHAEFGVVDLKEAKALLTKLTANAETAEEAYRQALKKFEIDWKDVLGESD